MTARCLALAALAAALACTPAQAGLDVREWPDAARAAAADRPYVEVARGPRAGATRPGHASAQAGAFRFHGAQMRRGDDGFLAPANVTGWFATPPWAVTFSTRGARVALLLRGSRAPWRLRVDGRPAAEGVLPPGGRARRLRLEFPTRAIRDLTLEAGGDLRWGGAVARGLRTPDLTLGPRAIFLGDSYTSGAGASAPYGSWAITAGRLLGWDAWASGRGTTGYANPGFFEPGATFADRVRRDVIRFRPDVVVVAGGINDVQARFYSVEAVREGAQRLFATLRRQLPAARLVVLGPWQVRRLRTARFDAIHAAIAGAAAEAGATFLDNVAQGWMAGDDLDWILGPDRLHPTQAGHDHIARRFAEAARTAGL